MAFTCVRPRWRVRANLWLPLSLSRPHARSPARTRTLHQVQLDEIAYDRQTMMRARKLLDARDGVIDHHSDSGAFCTSPAMIYAEHYPFIDKLWYGEGFDYATSDPAYWLVEMSGLVFGLTADMLRYPGMTPYHFRGMLFGESNRWQGGMDPATVTTDPFVPVALWRLWQDIGISAAVLHGFWLEEALGTSSMTMEPRAASEGGDHNRAGGAGASAGAGAGAAASP